MRRLMTALVAVAAIVATAAAQHSLDTLEIYVLLNRDGSAYVQEQRDMYAGRDGTECYIRMYNLGNMEVSDLEVWEKATTADGRDTTITYVNEGGWDVNRTREQKALRCGIIEVADGQELCWGLGEPGRHKYYVGYTLKGLVKSYTDFDGFNHNFYEADTPTADYARVVIRLGGDYRRMMAQTADSLFEIPRQEKNCNVRDGVLTIADKTDTTIVERYTLEKLYVEEDTIGPDTASIWAFGYYGSIIFDKGYVLATTEQSMSQSDKMIIMCRFRKGLFSPTLSYPDKSFETDVRELAFIDSDYTLDDPGDGSMSSIMGGDTTPKWLRILYMVLGGLCCIGLPLFFGFYALFGKRIARWWDRRKVRKLLGDAPTYYYDVPLDGNLIQSRRVLRAMEPSADESEMKLVEAYVLSLVDAGMLEVTSQMDAKGATQSLFHVHKPGEMQVSRFAADDRPLLQQLLSLLYQAAGDDHLLQPRELKDLIESDPVTVRSFARNLRDLNDKQLRPAQITRDMAQQVYGFWKYLKDFTLVSERALQEVALWNTYLTFATLFGIADQVRKDMRRIAPDLQAFDKLTRQIVENTDAAVLYSALSSSIMDSCRRTIYYETDAERRARQAREARERRYSGGGGRSSFGGGGGFSGGGGSGVR